MKEIPKNVIHMNMFFHLPDNFDGGVSDALRLMADYHDSVKGTNKQEVVSDFESNEHYEKLWNEFLNTLESNRKFHGCVGISKYDKENNKYDLIEDFYKNK